MNFRINYNPDRDDVIHDARPGEQCNQDDAINRGTIDYADAAARLAAKTAVTCKHCLKKGLPPLPEEPVEDPF